VQSNGTLSFLWQSNDLYCTYGKENTVNCPNCEVKGAQRNHKDYRDLPAFSAIKLKSFNRWPKLNIHTYVHTYVIDHSPLGLLRANETNNWNELKEAWKGFLVGIVFVKQWKMPKKDIS